ncbi:MAG: hypothetical protein HYY31_04820 [Chloroflexi bacterium]|nr:hypothetical protein [Chloroflexota bacterium]
MQIDGLLAHVRFRLGPSRFQLLFLLLERPDSGGNIRQLELPGFKNVVELR